MSNSLLSSAVIAVIVVIVSGYAVSYSVGIDTVVDTVFTGMLDAAYATHGALSLIATDSFTDDNDTRLRGASDVAVFKSGGNTYAVVTAGSDRAVQVLDITYPSSIAAAGKIRNTDNMQTMTGVTTFESGGNMYAIATAFSSDKVHVLNVTNPSNITSTSVISNNSTLELNAPWGITTYESGGNTYAAVAGYSDRGVQILDVTDPSNIIATGSTDDSTTALRGVKGVTAFESGGHTYVAAAAFIDDAVEILNVTNPSNITATDRISNDGNLRLNGAEGITSFKLDSGTYVAVTANVDNGVQILNVTNPLNVTAAGDILDDNINDMPILGPTSVTAFKSGAHTYLAVTTFGNDSGVVILDVTDPSDILYVDSITSNSVIKLRGAWWYNHCIRVKK